MNQTDAHSLLIVDDDPRFCNALAAALRRREFVVTAVQSAAVAAECLRCEPPRFAVIDLKLGADSGLPLVARANASAAPVTTIVLTGYASIATAVEAVKLGAVHYLTKPAEVSEILAALELDCAGDAHAPLPPEPPSVKKLEWEHIQSVLHAHHGNISATARALNMHRRTLQRKLRKRPVRR